MQGYRRMAGTPRLPKVGKRLQGSSCMHGNVPVQFLGEGVAATPPPYPTRRLPREPYSLLVNTEEAVAHLVDPYGQASPAGHGPPG